MNWAASKYLLQIRQVRQEHQHHVYTYHQTREDAAAALIERETKAIALAEKNLKRHKARLAAFIKKERR